MAGLINTSDQVVNTYEYDPWGQPLSATEGVVQPLQYAGRERDSETGFYYVRARYYDPELGRLISEDPIGLAGGVNPYAYVVDDPVNGRDPFGLCPAGEELIIEVDEGAGTATVSCSGGGDSVTLPVYTLDGVTVTAAAPDPFGGINKLMDDFMARGDQIANAARQYSLSACVSHRLLHPKPARVISCTARSTTSGSTPVAPTRRGAGRESTGVSECRTGRLSASGALAAGSSYPFLSIVPCVEHLGEERLGNDIKARWFLVLRLPVWRCRLVQVRLGSRTGVTHSAQQRGAEHHGRKRLRASSSGRTAVTGEGGRGGIGRLHCAHRERMVSPLR